MKSANQDSKPGHVTRGDIFDDLGFSPEETLEARIKADLWQAIVRHVERQELTQAQVVALLKIHQPDVSNLLKGKISRFSITKLIQFAGRLNLTTQVRVTSPKGVSVQASARAVSRKIGKVPYAVMRQSHTGTVHKRKQKQIPTG